MQKEKLKKVFHPAQHQFHQPGREKQMHPRPDFYDDLYRPAGKLTGKTAIITGGDSGIGRSVAACFAAEGADVAIIYLEETDDARFTSEFIQDRFARKCIMVKCDIRKESNCKSAINKILKKIPGINILVNNAGIHYPQDSILKITNQQLEKTFRTNVFSMFYLCKAVLPFMNAGDSIINTASVTAYRGSGHLVDYASSKGAIVSFTRSLAQQLAEKNIRVNAVAPGPIWTPLIVASFKKEKVRQFGTNVPLKRAGEPIEVAPAYVFLASSDSSYITGQVIHINGGEIING